MLSVGGEFRLDGELIDGLDTEGNSLVFNLPDRSVLTGTLADGTPFAFMDLDSDRFDDDTLTLSAAKLPPIHTAVIMLPGAAVPLGVRDGQTLVVDDDGLVGDNFGAGLGSTVIVTGGQVGNNFEAVGARVTISGGTVGKNFDAFGDSVIDISGGDVGRSFNAFSESVVNISGGLLGDFFYAHRDSEVTISGGLLGDFFYAYNGSKVNLFGTEFVLDDIDITTSLMLNVPFTINDREVVLNGLFADGSPFSFDLTTDTATTSDWFHSGALLTVTLILPGDYNNDGVVDAADYSVWRDGMGTAFAQGDYDTWKENFGASLGNGTAQSAIVPEPASVMLWGWAILRILPRRRRSADRLAAGSHRD